MNNKCSECPVFELCEPDKKGYVEQKHAIKAACNENKNINRV
jgi:hypothetical protein